MGGFDMKHSPKSLIHNSPFDTHAFEVFCPDCFICFSVPIASPYGAIQEQQAQARAIRECNEDYPECHKATGTMLAECINRRTDDIQHRAH
jgi:hypothetical protein